MSNTSASGGYLTAVDDTLPGSVTLEQFLQAVIVGITGLGGTLVRPKWQKNPPKQPPTPETDWCAFGITVNSGFVSPVTEVNEAGDGAKSSSIVTLNMLLSFYGPNARVYASRLRDGLWLGQNRDVLRTGKIGVKELSDIVFVPEVHGGVTFPRADFNVVLVREEGRTWKVLSILGAQGDILGEKSNNEIETVPFSVEQPT